MKDFGASVDLVSKRDFNKAELETMKASRNPTTVMTANGEVQTREEATVYVKELDLIVKVMLLEENPAVLSLGKLCEDHGFHLLLEKRFKNLSPKMGRLIASYQTMYNSQSLVCKRVPLRRHTNFSIVFITGLYLMSADTPKIQ